MNSMEAFLGLLVLAYLGSMLVGGRSIRGYGLPSGSEYLLLGVAIGPRVLGLVNHATLSLFEPILQVGVCWLSLYTGLGWGVIGREKGRFRTLLGSVVLALASGSLVACAVYVVAGRVTTFSATERLVLGGVAGAVGTETTRIAVRWVFERHGADGPLSRLIAALSDSDELPALLLVAFLFVLVPLPVTALDLPAWCWLLITLGLGVVLGLTCIALIGDQLHRGEALSFLLGATLLGTGIAAQLGLAGIVCTFIMGMTLSAGSRHRVELRQLLKKSEAPVMLPVLLLAGAHIEFDTAPYVRWIVITALGARILGKWLSGLVLLAVPAARRAGPLLGFGLLPAGVVTICIGLSLFLRLRSPVGDLALAMAAAMALLGEVVGPLFLRRALDRAGELKGAPALAETSVSASASGATGGAS